MRTGAFAPATRWQAAPGRPAAATSVPVARLALVVNMGLEEIQKQAKAA